MKKKTIETESSNDAVNGRKGFTWNQQKKKAALLLSAGECSQKQVADRVGVTQKTIWEWNKSIDFAKEVDRLTIENETITRAGLLRECLKGLREKIGYVKSDKSTHLDYIKAIVDIQGYAKQQIEFDGKMRHSGEIDINTLTDEELLKIITGE